MTQEEVVGLVVDALERLGVAYMVVGSFASNFHGVPRMTQDADLVVDLEEAGALRLARELDKNFYVSEQAVREAVRLRRLFNAIHLESGFKVDIVIKKDRPFSDSEMARRMTGLLGRRRARFASAEDTILTKLEWSRAAGSDRQYADAQGIMNVQGASLDWAYLERWADDLGVRALLDGARRGE